MKSDVLVSLIKEVVKSEVKRQVKEEVIKLIKSGDITLNNSKKTESTNSMPKRSLSEMLDVTPTSFDKPIIAKPKKIKEYTKDPLLNEILSETQPFTSAHRVAGGMGAVGGSILDAIQPTMTMEDDWETMDYRQTNMPEMSAQPMDIVESDNDAVNALTKALKRDYRELVKRF